MQKRHSKIYKYLPLLLLASVFISSCFKFENNGTAIPRENPLILTAEAQTVTTQVKNLTATDAENPETDRVTINNVVTENKHLWSRIENEWITIFHELSPKNHEKVKITVKENDSGLERRYVLGLDAKGKKSSLTIIQEAKI